MKQILSQLQIREAFHLEFLRWFSRKVKAEYFAIKGGANMRFFFQSFRYSEDLDVDIQVVEVEKIRDVVMKIGEQEKVLIDCLYVSAHKKEFQPLS